MVWCGKGLPSSRITFEEERRARGFQDIKTVVEDGHDMTGPMMKAALGQLIPYWLGFLKKIRRQV